MKPLTKKPNPAGLLRRFSKSVQGTLILYFIIIAVIPTFLLGIITYSTSSRIINNKVQIYVEEMIIKVKENIEYYFRDLQSLAYMISVNNDLLTALREETFLDRWKEINYNNKLKHFLASLTSTRAEVRGIYVISEDEKRIYSSGPPILISYLQEYDWYQEIVKSNDHLFITDIHEDDYAGALNFNTSKVVTYAQRITDLDGRKLGWVLIDLNYGFVTKMVPGAVTLIPSYYIILRLNMANTFAGLVLPFFFGSAFGTFLLRQFYMTLPKDLFEAATIDGAGYFQIWLKVMFPLSKPAVATLGVMTLVHHWNSLLWPLVITQSPSLKVLAVGLSDFRLFRNIQWNSLMAAVIIAILPMLIILFFAQKYFVKGIQFSGVNR